MSIEVRRATEDDVPWLLAEITAFEKFAGYKHPLITGNKQAPEILRKLIEGHVVLVAWTVTPRLLGRVGFILGFSGKHPLAPHLKVLSELFWWVVPAWQKSSAGARLFKEFERIGREEILAHWISTGHLEGKPSVKAASLEKRGFRRVEVTYLLEV